MSEFSDAIERSLDAGANLTATIEDIQAILDADELPSVSDLIALQDALTRVDVTGTATTEALDQAQAESDAEIAQLIGADAPDPEEDTDLLMTMPLQLTKAGGDEHPRMGLGRDGDIWLVWHSTRTGSEEVYVSRYFGECGIWNAPGQGGEDLKITNFGQQGRKAMFPSVSVDSKGEAHVVFQGQTESGWDVFYSHSTGGGASFTKPIRITRSEGNALSPDVVAVRAARQDFDGSADRLAIFWHDDRFGDFEIMSAQRVGGAWRSSGQDGSDIRITSAVGDSLFPRAASDRQGNIRVVYHDLRRGEDRSGIYMSTFVAASGRWDSSAQGGADRLVSNSPADALHPDIDIDHTGGVGVSWHDLRHMGDNPDQHEEVYALYCPRMGHPGGVHFPPLQPNVEARLDVDFEIVDCVNFERISLTNSPEVCLMIRAPGATFWRAANEDGQFTDWQQFRPNLDLETTVVPWTLTCVGGQKRICVQVQDADMVGFPVCREVTLAIKPPQFRVEFFQDEDMTAPLPTFMGRPVAREGDVFVRMTADVPQLSEPTYDVINRGQHLIFNQETEVAEASGFSGASSAGIGSFVGTTIDLDSAENASPVSKAFSAAVGRVFKSRFNVKKDDGLLHLDGLARLVPTGQDICGPVKSASASDQQTASSIRVVRGEAGPVVVDDPTDFESSPPPPQPEEPEVPPPPPPPEEEPPVPAPFTISLGNSGTIFPFNCGLGGVPPVTGGTIGNYSYAQPITLSSDDLPSGFKTAIIDEITVAIEARGSTAGRFLVVELHDEIAPIQGVTTTRLAHPAFAVIPASSLPTGSPTSFAISPTGTADNILGEGVKKYIVLREASSSNPNDVSTDPDGFFVAHVRNDGAPQGRILTGSPRSDFIDDPATARWPGNARYSFDMTLKLTPRP